MNKAAAWVVLGVVLLMIGPGLFPATRVHRMVLDTQGQPVRDADGRCKLERDPIGQFKVDWPGYAVMAAGGLCILYGIGSALRKRVRGSGT